ncbi:MAG: hypothetical protein ACLVGQ_13065 [Blautia massiliensis (ex Durand et al. 2017)]|uniref:hypothetical protein n=1 Tax=Blautia massiliensis (ex Durand et al. 2017) TaxID=1737424 RepID=UPI00399CFA89
MALPQDGQNANALATVKEVPTGKKLIFVDPTTNEGGVITLEDLTTQILKNLTSQTFALDQGTKTLPAALNELNSNPLSILTRSAILLEQAFDYNELKTTGAYYLTGSDPALAKNRPADCTNCYMLVFALIPTRVCQIILPGNDDRAWIRSTVTDSSEWRSWVTIF